MLRNSWRTSSVRLRVNPCRYSPIGITQFQHVWRTFRLHPSLHTRFQYSQSHCRRNLLTYQKKNFTSNEETVQNLFDIIYGFIKKFLHILGEFWNNLLKHLLNILRGLYRSFIRLSKKQRLVLLSTPVVGTAVQDTSENLSLKEYIAVLKRFLRIITCVTKMALDYKISLAYAYGDDYEKAKKEAHKRNAPRLQKLFLDNGGIYIKFGQHMAQLHLLLPDEYVEAMQIMLTEAPTSSFESVRKTIESELGYQLGETFYTFPNRPIASASLAQVHIARLKATDDLVAVKIQHEGLQEMCKHDTWLIETIITKLHKYFPEFNYNWLVKEIKANLPRELDFRAEAENCRRFEKNFKHRDDVAVPQIYHVTPKVLIMEYIHGCPVNDLKTIKSAMRMDPKVVSKLMSEVYCEQIFLHGFVHCDPHPGNILVRAKKGQENKRSNVKPQLVMLDHGLYKELDSEFRTNYAYLWNAIIHADKAEIEKYARLLNVGELYPLLASILTRKPWDVVVTSQKDSVKQYQQEQKKAQELVAQRSKEAEEYMKNSTNESTNVLFPKSKELSTRDTVDRFLDNSYQNSYLNRLLTWALNLFEGAEHSSRLLVSVKEKERLQQNAILYRNEIQKLLANVSSHMLLLFKTNDSLLANDLKLGNPFNTYLVTARYSLRAIHEDIWRKKRTVVNWCKIQYERFMIETKFSAFEFLMNLIEKREQQKQKDKAMILSIYVFLEDSYDETMDDLEEEVDYDYNATDPDYKIHIMSKEYDEEEEKKQLDLWEQPDD